MSVGVRGATAVVATAMTLSGCATGEHYATATAASLQRQLLSIAQSAASRDYSRALQQLTQLQGADDAALKAGTVTAARHDAIATAIGQVRADLTLLRTQAEARALEQRRARVLASRAAATVTHAAAPAPAPVHHAPAPRPHEKHGGPGPKHGG